MVFEDDALFRTFGRKQNNVTFLGQTYRFLYSFTPVGDGLLVYKLIELLSVNRLDRSRRSSSSSVDFCLGTGEIQPAEGTVWSHRDEEYPGRFFSLVRRESNVASQSVSFSVDRRLAGIG